MYIYVASPYSDPDPNVMEDRYLQVMKYTAHLITQGQWAYSPIVHCHDMALRHNFPKEHHFWMGFDAAMIMPSKEMHILQIEGWDGSKGIKHELEFCSLIQKPVKMAYWNKALEVYRLSDRL